MGDSPYIGEISMFAGNFAPSGWMICDGRLLPITQYQALFALIGTMYGGNGTSNFALPDLRGRLPLGTGSGPGLSPRNLGAMAGAEQVTLQVGNMPQHAHGIVPSKPVTATLKAVNTAADVTGPEEAYLAMPAANIYRESGAAVAMNAGSIAVDASGINTTQNAGQSTPVSTMPPFLAINFIIAWSGLWPPRD